MKINETKKDMKHYKLHQPKNYYRIYKDIINSIYDFLASHDLYCKKKDGTFVDCNKELLKIVRGDKK